MPRSPDQKYLRSDTTINQCALDDHGKVVGIDDQDVHSVWTDILSLGNPFRRNIADETLGRSMQPRRGKILITRDGTTHDTRAISYSAKKHEQPRVTLPHNIVQTVVPREDEKSSLATARHQPNSRANWLIGHEHKDRGTKIRQLSRGGWQSATLGNEYKRKAEALERLEKIENAEKARLAQIIPQDNIIF